MCAHGGGKKEKQSVCRHPFCRQGRAKGECAAAEKERERQTSADPLSSAMKPNRMIKANETACPSASASASARIRMFATCFCSNLCYCTSWLEVYVRMRWVKVMAFSLLQSKKVERKGGERERNGCYSRSTVPNQMSSNSNESALNRQTASGTGMCVTLK